MDSFLNLLNPLIKNWHFQGVTFCDVTANQIRVCSDIKHSKKSQLKLLTFYKKVNIYVQIVLTCEFIIFLVCYVINLNLSIEALKFVELIKPADGYYIAKMITQGTLCSRGSKKQTKRLCFRFPRFYGP